MANLSDTQLVILNAACQRDSGQVLPLPDRIKGGAANKVVSALVSKGLIEEVDAVRTDQVWRQTGSGHGVTLVITAAGYTALGVNPPAAAQAATQPAANETPATPAEPAPKAGLRRQAGADAGGSRSGSKQAAVIELLRRPEGATAEEIATATGWQRHTIRGAIAGAIKKKLGLEVTATKEEDRGRVYRIQPIEAEAQA